MTTPIDWKKQPLGEQPDAYLVGKLGVSRQAVAAARKRLGIPQHAAPIDQTTFGGALRQARMDKGLALAALGAEVGVSFKQIICDLEGGRRYPATPELPLALAKALGAPQVLLAWARGRENVPVSPVGLSDKALLRMLGWTGGAG